MSKTTHADLVFNILAYVTETLAEGDIDAALDLGFRVDQVERLQHLTLQDLHHLSTVRGHFMEVAVDPACLDRVLEHLQRNKHSETLQDELIRLRAPVAMMQAFYGMTNAEYAARRKLLGMAGTGVGRPPAPSEAEERQIWDSWQESVAMPLTERYLQVGRETGLPLSTVWSLVQSWKAEGLLSDATGEPRTQSDKEGKVVRLPRAEGG
ncbi:MAG: DUF2857 domain-containing protein [Gammaproteobacteria bacterium]|nr:DUF2857 domain-containing protein [Gammaproteobacteria bacterium]